MEPIDFQLLYATIKAAMPLQGPSADPEAARPLTDDWPKRSEVGTRRAKSLWADKALYLQAMKEGHHKGVSATLCITEVHKACGALTPLFSTEETGAKRHLILTIDTSFKRLTQAIAPETANTPHLPLKHTDIPLNGFVPGFMACSRH